MVSLKGTRCFLTQFSGSELVLTHCSWSPVPVTCAWSVLTSPSCPTWWPFGSHGQQLRAQHCLVDTPESDGTINYSHGALVVGLGQAVDGPRP